MEQNSDIAHRLKDHAADLTDKAKATVTQEVGARTENFRDAAAGKIQAAANAADAAASELDPASTQAQAMMQVADHIEGVAAKIRTADLGQLAQQTAQAARQNPLLFIGGAALLGFAAARFMKAQGPAPSGVARETDPWAAPLETGGTYNV